MADEDDPFLKDMFESWSAEEEEWLAEARVTLAQRDKTTLKAWDEVAPELEAMRLAKWRALDSNARGPRPPTGDEIKEQVFKSTVIAVDQFIAAAAAGSTGRFFVEMTALEAVLVAAAGPLCMLSEVQREYVAARLRQLAADVEGDGLRSLSWGEFKPFGD